MAAFLLALVEDVVPALAIALAEAAATKTVLTVAQEFVL